MRVVRSFLALITLASSLAGCSHIPFFGDDDDDVVIELREPAELTSVTEELRIHRVWNVSAGSGDEGKSVRMRLLLLPEKIAVAGENGQVGVYQQKDGRSLWSRTVDSKLSAGVGGDEQSIVVGNAEGVVYCLNGNDGTERWQLKLSSEVDTISRTLNNIVVVRTHDSKIYGIEVTAGSLLWNFSRSAPALLLQGTSVPLVDEGVTYVGFDSGQLVALSLDSGEPLWEARVAVPSGRSELERLVDIDGQMIIDGDIIYVVSFQGRVAALAKATGRVIWSREMSSSRGLTLDADKVYVSDSDSVVWALDKNSGVALWKQDQLLYRSVSAPAVVESEVLVGDFEGYVHVLSTEDGHFTGRQDISGEAILAPPVVDENQQIYFLDQNGHVSALEIKSLKQ